MIPSVEVGNRDYLACMKTKQIPIPYELESAQPRRLIPIKITPIPSHRSYFKRDQDRFGPICKGELTICPPPTTEQVLRPLLSPYHLMGSRNDDAPLSVFIFRLANAIQRKI